MALSYSNITLSPGISPVNSFNARSAELMLMGMEDSDVSVGVIFIVPHTLCFEYCLNIGSDASNSPIGTHPVLTNDLLIHQQIFVL